MPFVLTERFCQDILEEYFGNQRAQGRRSDNPDLQSFGYNDNASKVKRFISHTSGNTRGKYNRKRAWESVSDEKLKKRKRK